MQFRPIQALALFVCHLNGGGFLPVGTGHGKELISRLAADAVGARKPLLLIPPDMRAPFAAHTPEYARSFRLPPNVTVMAYSQLSMATSTDALERLMSLANTINPTNGRFMRWRPSPSGSPRPPSTSSGIGER